MASRQLGRLNTLELDLRNLASSGVGFKAGALLELEDTRKDVAGEGLDTVVVVQYAVVVALACVGNLILGVLKRRLKLREVRVRLEVGIGFGDREELAQRTGQDVVGSHLLIRGGSAGSGVACADDSVEGFLLVRGVALDRLDQVGNEVVAALQLRVDVLPRVVDAVAQRDEVIVNAGDRADCRNYPLLQPDVHYKLLMLRFQCT